MTLYCECETPLIDVEHDAGCRRCGCPVDFSPALAAEVNAAIESARIASIDPSDRAGFSRRVGPIAAAALAALAFALPAGASTKPDPCAKAYGPVPTITVGSGLSKRTLPLYPVMLAYAKCVRASVVQPLGRPDVEVGP